MAGCETEDFLLNTDVDADSTCCSGGCCCCGDCDGCSCDVCLSILDDNTCADTIEDGDDDGAIDSDCDDEDGDNESDIMGCCNLLVTIGGGVVGTGVVGIGVGGNGGKVVGGGRGVEEWVGGSGAVVGRLVPIGKPPLVATWRATAVVPGLAPPSTGPNPPSLALVLRTLFSL